MILFEAREVDYALFDDPPNDPINNIDVPATPIPTRTEKALITSTLATTGKACEEAKIKYAKDNKTVTSHLSTRMIDNMFDISINQKSLKEIWDTLLKHC